MINISNIEEKIKKLMAILDPNSGATEGEKSNAMTLLHKLVIANNIDLSSIQNNNDGLIHWDIINTETTLTYKKRLWGLIAYIGDLFNCKVYVRGKKYYNIVGTPESVRLCIYTYVSLSTKIKAAAYKYARSKRRVGGKYKLNSSKYWNFITGACTEINTRIWRITREYEKNPDNSKELVIIDSLKNAINEFLIEFGLKKFGRDLKVVNRKEIQEAQSLGRMFGNGLNIQPIVKEQRQNSKQNDLLQIV